MSTAAKLLSAMRRNPNDWSMPNVLRLAQHHGLEVRNNGGSHCVFSHPLLAEHLTIPARRPIKPLYIKRLVTLIDQVQASSSS